MKWLKGGAVVLASVIVTTLVIGAADNLGGTGNSLLGQLIGSESDVCPVGMVAVPAAQSFTCVDVYEASVGENCLHSDPINNIATNENLASLNCGAASKADALPWRFISREQAVTACLRSGKRLITASEWYTIAAGTPDTAACNSDSGNVRPTAADKGCVSAVGVIDTIGNVWEWTADDVIDGVHDGIAVPDAGYVTQVSADGFPLLTEAQPAEQFAADYLWSHKEGAYGVLRGGFYGSGSDGGVYSVHAETKPTAAGTAIGFRCVL